MPRCNRCPPCFVKRCGMCINCFKNSKGNRVHRKCRRQICLQDRPIPKIPKVAKKSSKHVKELLDIAKKSKNACKKIKKAKACVNPANAIEMLKNLPFLKQKKKNGT